MRDEARILIFDDPAEYGGKPITSSRLDFGVDFRRCWHCENYLATVPGLILNGSNYKWSYLPPKNRLEPIICAYLIISPGASLEPTFKGHNLLFIFYLSSYPSIQYELNLVDTKFSIMLDCVS